jgi:hypothetical protein
MVSCCAAQVLSADNRRIDSTSCHFSVIQSRLALGLEVSELNQIAVIKTNRD